MTTTDENKATVIDFIDALFTKGDLDAADRWLSDDFINHDPPFNGPTDREGMRQAAQLVRTACPDWHSKVDLLIAEDDLVVEYFTASGTHTGELMGVPGTGKELTLAGINIFRVDGGVITERWGRLDEAGLAQQIGLG
jgi:steroid delta-isomerase-like uncharacterized protein